MWKKERLDLGVIGNTLRDRRKSLDLTLKQISDMVGVSENRISEIEKGVGGKVPSDVLTRELAKAYKLDERTVFKGFGKVPISLVEELERHEGLMNTLYRIQKNKRLTEDNRDKLYEEIEKLYVKHLEDEGE